MLQIYLAIIETYIAISFSLLIILMINNKNISNDVKLDNKLWKDEMRLKLSILEKKIEGNSTFKTAKYKENL